MKHFIKPLFILLFTICTSPQAEVAIIVNPSNNSQISESEIQRIFLGKITNFPDGELAVPINQSEQAAATDEFNTDVLKKSSSQLKVYWSKVLFTGQGTPPKVVTSDEEVVKLVSANPNLIGYIDSSMVTSSVKVIAKF
jgi:ABC-type phosphate transport system substrate-binding protein